MQNAAAERDQAGDHVPRPAAGRPHPEPSTAPDLLTIGLLVFFVSLVVIVAAMLLLPQIL